MSKSGDSPMDPSTRAMIDVLLREADYVRQSFRSADNLSSLIEDLLPVFTEVVEQDSLPQLEALAGVQDGEWTPASLSRLAGVVGSKLVSGRGGSGQSGREFEAFCEWLQAMWSVLDADDRKNVSLSVRSYFDHGTRSQLRKGFSSERNSVTSYPSSNASSDRSELAEYVYRKSLGMIVLGGVVALLPMFGRTLNGAQDQSAAFPFVVGLLVAGLGGVLRHLTAPKDERHWSE